MNMSLTFFTFSVQMPGTLSEGPVLHVSVLEKKIIMKNMYRQLTEEV